MSIVFIEGISTQGAFQGAFEGRSKPSKPIKDEDFGLARASFSDFVGTSTSGGVHGGVCKMRSLLGDFSPYGLRAGAS